MQISTIRPGIFVALNTAIDGNVSYTRTEIEAEHLLDNGMSKAARWETAKLVADASEHERATIARSKARSVVTACCAKAAIGYLCPNERADDLESAVKEALRIAEEFNVSASLTRVNVYVKTFRVEQDDVEAVRQINKQVRQLIDDMASGVQRLDVDAVREAANTARQLSDMLSDDAQEKIQVAIKTSRDAARKIVKAGESAAVEIDRAAVRKIEEARAAFLDLDEAQDVAAPQAAASELDLAPETITPPQEYKAAGWTVAETSIDL
jgi:hypothetical protein